MRRTRLIEATESATAYPNPARPAGLPPPSQALRFNNWVRIQTIHTWDRHMIYPSTDRSSSSSPDEVRDFAGFAPDGSKPGNMC